MANQYASKIVINGVTEMDLTADTVTASDILLGKTAHDRSGAPITGTCTYDANTSDATALAGEILATKTAYVNGTKVTGSMTNRGAGTGTISSKDEQYSILAGYYDGSGKVGIANAEKTKIIPDNIREGITILGVLGTMSGSEGVNPQSKTVTPTFEAQTILPDSAQGYNYLSAVTVNAITVTRTDNPQGGVTVTVG